MDKLIQERLKEKENKMSVENQIINKLIKSYKIMRDASFQSHSGHFDQKGTHGRNCPECIGANKLRDEANEFFDKVMGQISSL